MMKMEKKHSPPGPLSPAKRRGKEGKKQFPPFEKSPSHGERRPSRPCFSRTVSSAVHFSFGNSSPVNCLIVSDIAVCTSKVEYTKFFFSIGTALTQ